MLAKESVLMPYLSLMRVNEDEEGIKYIDTSIIDFVINTLISDGEDKSGDVAEIARFISIYNSNNTDISRVTFQEAINITSLLCIFQSSFPMFLHIFTCVYKHIIYFVEMKLYALFCFIQLM